MGLEETQGQWVPQDALFEEGLGERVRKREKLSLREVKPGQLLTLEFLPKAGMLSQPMQLGVIEAATESQKCKVMARFGPLGWDGAVECRIIGALLSPDGGALVSSALMKGHCLEIKFWSHELMEEQLADRQPIFWVSGEDGPKPIYHSELVDWKDEWRAGVLGWGTMVTPPVATWGLV